MLISVISPIYKGEKMLDELVSRIEAAVETFTRDYEIILVNDCSPDDSWSKMKEICASDKKVKGINLSRNFGQHYAITAGLTESTGEWVVVLDCDLQDRPEEIPNLYKKAQEGYDTVFAEIVERNDNFLKKFSSQIYYHLFAFISDRLLIDNKNTNNFCIFNRKVADSIQSMGDYIRCLPMQIRWVGFKIGYHQVVKDSRLEGTSSYTIAKLFLLAFNNIISFSSKPLFISLQIGFIIVIGSTLLSVYYLVRFLYGGIGVSGFTTIVLSIWFMGGMLISLMGMIGLYIGRVFDKVRNRPSYIVDERINL